MTYPKYMLKQKHLLYATSSHPSHGFWAVKDSYSYSLKPIEIAVTETSIVRCYPGYSKETSLIRVPSQYLFEPGNS